MIDPFNITNYNRTVRELEEFILFVCFVPSKSAVRTANNLEELLNKNKWNISPFKKIEHYINNNKLREYLEEIGFGQYRKLEKCMDDLIYSNLDLNKCTIADLENIFGIGPKSARFFILHSRKDARVCCLDVHVLKFMASHGYDVPKTTPPRNKYLEIEKEFLKLSDLNNISPADFDLKIWSMYARNGKPDSVEKSQILITKDEKNES